MNIQIKLKRLGKKKVHSVALVLDCTPDTLRALIESCVRSEVKRYNDKRHAQDSDTKILSFLSPTDISGQLQTGKVDFAAITNMTMANQQKAIDDALLAFKDGLFLVFVNDEEIRTLDAALLLSEDSEIAFIRMTFLTGTYW